MERPGITKSEIIVVDTIYDNEYGDLLFTDIAGTEYKISAKRVKYFDMIKPDVAVQLNFSTAYGKEYIYNATVVEDYIPPEEEPEPAPKPTPIKPRHIPQTSTTIPKTVTPPPPTPAEAPPKTEKAKVSKEILLKDIISLHTMLLSYSKDQVIAAKDQILIDLDKQDAVLRLAAETERLADYYVEWAMKKLSKWL